MGDNGDFDLTGTCNKRQFSSECFNFAVLLKIVESSFSWFAFSFIAGNFILIRAPLEFLDISTVCGSAHRSKKEYDEWFEQKWVWFSLTDYLNEFLCKISCRNSGVRLGVFPLSKYYFYDRRHFSIGSKWFI